jgi:Rrf2 family protein
MKLLTRNTDYAVRAICCMASKPGRTSTVAELTDALDIPRPFLRKILQRLNKVGMVRSARGKAGGFRLAKDPYKLTLADFIEAFQGPFSINECVFKKKICPNTKRCALKCKIDEIEDYVEAQLKSVSIGSILNKEA